MQAIPGPPIFGAVQEPPMLGAVPPPYLYTGPKMPSKVEAESTENTFASMKSRITPMRVIVTTVCVVLTVVLFFVAMVVLLYGDFTPEPTKPPPLPEVRVIDRVASTASSPLPSPTSMATAPPTKPVLPAQTPMTRFPMVCVFGTATNQSQPLPADGVCDFTFYDGLYVDGLDTLQSPRFSAPVEHVLGHAALHSATQYGLSFDYRKKSEVAQDLEIPVGRSKIEELWTRGICHYGFLSIEHAGQNDDQDFRDIIHVLASLHALLQMQRSHAAEASYLAIGLFLEDTDIKGALDTMRQVYMPDLIIAHGHIGYDDRQFGTDCKMMYPTPFNSDGRYRESQLSAVAMLESINYDTTSLAVSVALFARRYKPAHPDPVTSSDATGFLPGMQCTSFRGKYLIPVSQFCTNRDYLRNHRQDPFYTGRATFSKTRQSTILYDNEFTLAEKLCLTKERHLGLSYGVAVYGLEYADHSGECPIVLRGAYARTRLAKALVRFFESRPNVDNMFDCASIRPEAENSVRS
ncbi:uncharacterized protein [Dermacentor albipictus]|uniref:uncharacterized protein isoform X2 n=1 Tax=Dermacentor albipictus TaxID=60249 RepID=UPI0038FBFC8B